MAKTIRINEGYVKNNKIGENDIYRKFYRQFDVLFNANEMLADNESFDSVYVHDFDFEEQLSNFKKVGVDLTKFCVGYTGIGKTTGIRKAFNLGISKHSILDEKNGMIVFPTFLDGYQVSDINKNDFAKRIASVCTSFREKYSDLKYCFSTPEGKRELYDFIRNHTDFILEGIDIISEMNLKEEEIVEKKLAEASKTHPFEFYANMLKYYIKKKYSIYNQLVIILDDIESLPEECQKTVVSNFLKLADCMRNTDRPANRIYVVKLLISVRPHTYRMLNNDRKIETFSLNTPIMKKESIDLQVFFKKRFDYYTKKYINDIGNMDTWKSCYNALFKMNNLFDGKYREMILNLCFKNVREALASYARIFANRFWVQKNKPKEDIFTVYEAEYAFNNINVIRALACNEERMYCAEMDSIIPNVFYTKKDFDYTIYCLLLIRFFYKNQETDEAYGLGAVKLSIIKEYFGNIFENDGIDNFISSINYLFLCKVLRKSIKDYTDLNGTSNNLNDESILYISPRGCELYRMFTRDSVLLEMYREAVWREQENWSYFKGSSSELMYEGKQDVIFLDLLEYIEKIYEDELAIQSSVRINNKISEYITLFSEEPVSKILLEGVKNSLDYSGLIKEERIKGKFFNLYNKIRDFK